METPAFKRIGITFKIDKQKFYGTVVASSDFLYLVMAQKRDDLKQGLIGGLGGVIGGLIAWAIASAGSNKPLSIETTTLSSLDPDVLNHVDWPVESSKKDSSIQVLVVPAELIELVEHPRFSNFLTFEMDDSSITVEYLLLRGKPIRDYLNATGWPVRWCGKNLVFGETA